jgi:acyl-CoA synthetase (NDP forming)/GNAT superfamily N-acetyltransferase
MTSPSTRPYPVHWEADVVLRDGGVAHVRPITPEDAGRLVAFYEQVSDESKYYRFFAPYPRLSDRDVHRFTHHDYDDRVGLAATVGGEFIATVRYDRVEPEEAEVAFLVQDAHQGRGVASALLEHIAAVARERGIRRFSAEVLPANRRMIKVFTDAGYTQRRSFADGVVRLEFGLEPTEKSVAVQRAREQRAEARSVRRLLAPRSIAVVGAGRAPGGVGRTLLRGIAAGGFTGRLYAVNRGLGPEGAVYEPEGVRAYRSVGEIPVPEAPADATGPAGPAHPGPAHPTGPAHPAGQGGPGGAVDLAVLAVPAASVPAAVDDCGRHGVRGLLVVASGYAESGPDGLRRQRDLVRQARSYGMRVVGPNAFGILNTAPGVRLNASLAPGSPSAGRLGLFTQSGAIGIALLDGLHRRGAGLSTFVSAGNRADVSGNDILQYWYDDPDTDVALMYLETLGNPRKFYRVARRTALRKPVVVVKGARHSGATPSGHAVPRGGLPDAAVSALLRQAGVIRVGTVTELLDAGRLLAAQPVPRGGRVAILGNSDSLGLLAYDACRTAGLEPAAPRDLTTGATPADFRAALAAALQDDAYDAVIVTAIPRVGGPVPAPAEAGPAPATDDAAPAPADDAALAATLRETAAGADKPVVVVHLALEAMAARLNAPGAGTPAAADGTGQTGLSSPLPGLPAPGAAPPETAQTGLSNAPVPTYPAPERAVRALAEAVAYGRWRVDAEQRPGRVPVYDDVEEGAAAEDIARSLRAADAARLPGEPGGTPERPVTLGDTEAAGLLARYGITVRAARGAPDVAGALRAAGELGYPVALKTTAPHLRHRADLGGVRLDLADEGDLRRAYEELTARLGDPARLGLVVQAMAPRGVDTVVGAVADPVAGTVLSFGLAGAPSALLGDLGHRLVPATDRDVAGLVRSIRAAPLLFGWRGAEPVDTAALEELLLRVSLLADEHPEVVAVHLDPVVVAPRGLTVLGATVRLARPPARSDLGPRALAAL